MMRDGVEPRAGVCGRGALRPRRERAQERRLDRIFDDVDVLHSNSAREHGHHATVFVSEEVFDQAGCLQGLAISRTSTLDPAS